MGHVTSDMRRLAHRFVCTLYASTIVFATLFSAYLVRAFNKLNDCGLVQAHSVCSSSQCTGVEGVPVWYLGSVLSSMTYVPFIYNFTMYGVLFVSIFLCLGAEQRQPRSHSIACHIQ